MAKEDFDLDDAQEDALYMDGSAPVLITGPARSGKSMALQLRAARMLRHWPWKRKRLLYLASRNYGLLESTYILGKLLSPEEQDLVDIDTPNNFFIAAWTHYCFTKSGRGLGGTLWHQRFDTDSADAPGDNNKRFIGREPGELFREMFTKTPRIGGLDEDAARREFADVVQEWDLRTREDYLAFARPPFFGALTEEARGELWDRLFGPATDFLAKARRQTSRAAAGALNCLAERVRSKKSGGMDAARLAHRYGAVFVDDAQNLSPAALRFLKTLAHNGNLTLAADCLEPIAQPVPDLARCGIRVSEDRVIRLHGDHSGATGAIRNFAKRLLDGLDIADLNGAPATLPPAAPLSGRFVEERQFATFEDMVAHIAAKIIHWRRPNGDYKSLIVVRDETTFFPLRTSLGKNHHIPYDRWTFADDGEEAEVDDWVPCVTVQPESFLSDEIGGASFANVVIVLDGWLEAQWDATFDGDPAARRARAVWALQTLYASAMRARKNLLIVSSDGTTVAKLREGLQ